MPASFADIHYCLEPVYFRNKYFDFEGNLSKPDDAYKIITYKYNEHGDCIETTAVLKVLGLNKNSFVKFTDAFASEVR